MQPADAPKRVRNAGALDAQLLRIAHMLKPAAAAVAVHGAGGRGAGGRGRKQLYDAGDCIAPAFSHKLGRTRSPSSAYGTKTARPSSPGHTPAVVRRAYDFQFHRILLRHAFIPPCILRTC